MKWLRLLTLILSAAMSAHALAKDFRERVHVGVADNNTMENDVIAEIGFGREVAAKILSNHQLLRNEALTRYVTLVGNRVARNANRPELTWYFAVLDTDSINAYTAPGGYIFVTKGALQQMEDEADLAAVLSHEVAHVTEKHIVKSLNIKGNDTSATSSLARLVGSVNESTRTAFNQAVDGAVSILFERGLNHKDEYQADKIGLIVLANSGYDPMALVRYLDRIDKAKPESTVVLTKTHPALSQRINLLNTLASQDGLNSIRGVRAQNRFINNLKNQGLNFTGEQP